MNNTIVKSKLFRSLVQCRNHWAWLAITGSYNKESYKPSQRWPYGCKCCSYAGATKASKNADNIAGYRDCSKCPLLGYAWHPYSKYESENLTFIACNRRLAFYYDWGESRSTSMRSYYAMRIVQACDKAIEDFLVHGRLRP